jgi:hypothetical protein
MAECLHKMKLVQNITLFLSIFLFIGLVYISFFNVYQTDDYIYSYGTRRLGVFENCKDFYLNWGGRYFGYSISTLNPVSEDKEVILPKIYPIFLMLAFIGVSALNFKHYFQYSLKKAFAKSFLLFFFYTVLLVSLPEHYFWITGANIYFLSVILSGFLLYFTGRYRESQNKTWFYLSIVLIILLMGSNELLALTLEGLLIIFYFQKRSKNSKVLLIIGSVFLLVSFLAPGNFKRLADTSDIFYIKWIKRIGVFGANSIYIFIKTILLLPLFIKVFEKDLKTVVDRISVKKAFIIWSVSFLPLIFAGYILNAIGRQFENIIFFYFMTGSVLLMIFYGKIKKYWWISLVIVFLPESNFFPQKYSVFNIDYNMNNFVNEIFSTDLKEYDREIENRIDVIKNSTEDSLVVEKIQTIPKILYFDEMGAVNGDKNYVNTQMEKYFNKKYIRVDKK